MLNNIAQHPVPLVLKRLMNDKYSGVLRVNAEGAVRELFFVDSRLVYARTSIPGERLGEILRLGGKLTRDQLEETLQAMSAAHTTEKIGKWLIQHKLLNHRDIYNGLLLQLKTIAVAALSQTSGEWSLAGDAAAERENFLFELEIPAIFAEGIDKIGQLEYFKSKLGPGKLKLLPVSRNFQRLFGPEDTWFYDRLAALENETISSILTRLDLPEPFFWKKIIFFYLLGLLDFDLAPGAHPIRDDEAKELAQIAEAVREGKWDYYQLLGVSSDATPTLIKKAYYNAARRFHPDRVRGDETLKPLAELILTELNRAFETLSDEHRRTAYDRKRTPGGDVSAKADEDSDGASRRELAWQLYLQGKHHFRRGQFQKAAALLETAIQNDDNNSKYWHLLGVCQMNTPSGKNSAAKTLQTAHEKDPWNPDPINALGMLFYNENLLNRAKALFKKALELDPHNEFARNKLREMDGVSTRKFSLSSILKGVKT